MLEHDSQTFRIWKILSRSVETDTSKMEAHILGLQTMLTLQICKIIIPIVVIKTSQSKDRDAHYFSGEDALH
jgi:hypothetical protein